MLAIVPLVLLPIVLVEICDVPMLFVAPFAVRLPAMDVLPTLVTAKVWPLVLSVSLAPLSSTTQVVDPVPPVIVAEVLLALMPFTWPLVLVTPIFMLLFCTLSTPVPVTLPVPPLVSTDSVLFNVAAPLTPNEVNVPTEVMLPCAAVVSVPPKFVAVNVPTPVILEPLLLMPFKVEPPLTLNPVKVPTDVKLEAVTPLASVAPVKALASTEPAVVAKVAEFAVLADPADVA